MDHIKQIKEINPGDLTPRRANGLQRIFQNNSGIHRVIFITKGTKKTPRVTKFVLYENLVFLVFYPPGFK